MIYDAANRRIETLLPDATPADDSDNPRTRTEYDTAGRVTADIDANGNLEQITDFNGTTIVHQYDVNDRLIGRAFPNDAAEAIAYDAVGNRIQASDGQGARAYAYDERNRLVREILPDGTTLGYGYDAEGSRTRLNLESAAREVRETRFEFDALNRLQTVIDASGGATQYRYDANGNREVMIYPNGTRTEYTYNARNQLTALATTDSTGQVAVAYTYDLHPTGRRLGSIEHSGRTTQYTLDAAYRLLRETITDPVNGNYSAEYQYDRVGNRTQSILDGVQTAYTYDANDRLLQAGGERYTYDANGNTLRVEIDSDLTTYQYDDRNRMVASSSTAVGVTTTSTYNYDLDGNRIAQTVDGETTEYIIDRNRDFAQVIREFSAGRDIHYTYGDDLIGQQSAAGAFYYHYDGLGSTRALTDDTETVTDTYDYEAFGDLLNRTGFTDNNYLYTSEQYDPNLDQYYLRARYYNQGIGRFTQMDTFQGVASDPITLHKYLYASADPVNNIDPSGNFSLVSFGVAQNMRSTLSNLQIEVGFSLLDSFLSDDPEKAAANNALLAGVAGLIGLGAGTKLLKLLSRKANLGKSKRIVSLLEDASKISFKAAKRKNIKKWIPKNKHLASSRFKRTAKFATDDIGLVRRWVSEGLRSPGAMFFPNPDFPGSFIVVANARRVIGTKGQSKIRIIVKEDGVVRNAFPVNVR